MEKYQYSLLSVCLSLVIGLTGCGLKKSGDGGGSENSLGLREGDLPTEEEIKGKVPGGEITSSEGFGGSIVACRVADGSVSLKTLDVFEAEILRSFTPIPLSDQTTPEVIVNRILDHFASKDPDLAAYYRVQSNEFSQKVKFIPDIRLPAVDDIGTVMVIPRNCIKLQLAIQPTPTFEGDVVYVIDKDLWDKLDNFNKASAILHAVIYRDALKRGHKNSYATRFLSGLIASKQLAAMPMSTYVETILSLNFPGGTGTQGVVKYWLDSKIERDASRRIIKINTSAEGERKAFIATRFFHEREMVNGGTTIAFYPTGELKSASLVSSSYWFHSGCQHSFKQDKQSYTHFDRNGFPVKIENTSFSICMASNGFDNLRRGSADAFEFYPGTLVPKAIDDRSGNPYFGMKNKCLSLPSDRDSEMDYYDPAAFRANRLVEFSLTGNVILKAQASGPMDCERSDGTKKNYVRDDFMTFDDAGFSLD